MIRRRMMTATRLSAHAAAIAAAAVISTAAGADFDFDDSTVIPTAAGIADIVLADLDGDGDLDIASLEGDSAPNGLAFISVLLNDGAGGFGPPDTMAVPVGGGLEFHVEDLDAADLDGDDDLDLVYIGSIAPLTFLFNAGDGTFGPAVPTEIVNNLSFLTGHVEVADLDGDGDADFVVTPPLRIVLRAANGDLVPIDMPNGINAEQVTVGDLDGDGDPDITAGSRVMINDGNASFTEIGFVIAAGGARDCELVDLDLDQDPDMACARTFPQLLGIALNDGAASFENLPGIQTDLFPSTVEVGQLDDDGIPDVVILAFAAAEIRRGQGDGGFDPPQTLAVAFGQGLAAGDLDGDGLDDLVIGIGHSDSPEGGLDIRLNRTPVTRPADLDGDGVVGTNDLLQLLAAWGPCPAPPDPCAADLDGDGQVGSPDLLALLADWG